MTDRYAVIGNPVEHSLSPQIHARFAELSDEDVAYHKIFAETDKFIDACTYFFAAGGKGMNVTLPFKQDAYDFADQLTPRAKAAGAVNTLAQQEDGQRIGDNTDGAGLICDLMHNQGLALGKMRILVLGAGGAVRGVLAPLLEQSPVALTLANRTAEKAARLAQHFADYGQVRGIGLAETGDFAPYDLIINGTSAGLSKQNPQLPDGLFAANACAYDMLYAAQPTPFLRWANSQGVNNCRDGFGMLVEQAAESFYLWRRKRPDTAQIIRKLRPY